MARKRAALAHLPVLNRIEDGRDSYLDAKRLRLYRGSATRYWTFHETPTTIERKDGTYLKSADSLGDHSTDEDTFGEFMRECADYGIPRPSSYGDLFHKLYKTPRVPWTINELLSREFVGGWQQALRPGAHIGRYYKYDIRSAYLWSGYQGFPDPRSYRWVRQIVSLPAVYRIDMKELVHDAPYPFNSMRRVLATDEEIHAYRLPVARVWGGIAWEAMLDPRPLLDIVRQFTFWKQVGRAYWGRWGMTAKIRCHMADGRNWNLPNNATNLVWAHTIVSRVRRRVWDASRGGRAVHVFVDSVITPDKLETGPGIGDWKLETIYPDGVAVRAAGCYGDLVKPDRVAGVARGSPLREEIAARWADHWEEFQCQTA